MEIIRIKDIATQEELQRELRERGFEVTQATVSRDIRRLNLAKRQIPEGRSIYVIPPEILLITRRIRIGFYAFFETPLSVW